MSSDALPMARKMSNDSRRSGSSTVSSYVGGFRMRSTSSGSSGSTLLFRDAFFNASMNWSEVTMSSMTGTKLGGSVSGRSPESVLGRKGGSALASLEL